MNVSVVEFHYRIEWVSGDKKHVAYAENVEALDEMVEAFLCLPRISSFHRITPSGKSRVFNDG